MAATRRRNPEARMSLGEHLVELRKRLTRAALGIVGGTIIGFMIYDLGWIGDLLDSVLPGAADALHEQGTWFALRGPIFGIAQAQGADAEQAQDIALNFTTITGAFDVQFQVALAAGIVLSSPVWLYQVFAFFVPGLNRREKSYTLGFFFTAVPLFLAGCVAGWFVLPRIVEVMFRFVPDGSTTLYDAKYGIAFVLPVFLVLLNFVGVLRGMTILKGWRWAVLAIVVFTALATPAADVLSMVLLAIPMTVLYFAAVGITVWRDRILDRRAASLEE